jgi:penicillin-binding protein 1A
MVKNGFVDAASVAQVDMSAIALQPTTKENSVRYFTDWALPQLDTLIDESNEPIEVWTTLDPGMQSAAERAIAANAPANAQGALVAIDFSKYRRYPFGGNSEYSVCSVTTYGTPARRATSEPAT